MAPSVRGHAPSGEGQHRKGQARQRLRAFLGGREKQPTNNEPTAPASPSQVGPGPSEKPQPQPKQPQQLPDKARSDAELPASALEATIKEVPERDLWQEAFDKLPERTRNKLNAGVAQKLTLRGHVAQLLEVAKKRQEECEGRAWKFHLGNRELVVRDFAVSIVEGVKKVGDIAINLAPPQASYAWSAFKMLLQVSVVDAEQMGALLVSVDKMLRVLNRSQIFESEYSAQNTSTLALQNLQTALVDLNGAVLELLADSSELLRKNTARQILHAVIHPGKTAGLFATLDELEDKLCRDVQVCQSEQVSAILTRIEGKEGLETLEWISSVPYGAHHNSVAEARLPETCNWLLEHETYRTWEDSTSSAMLWLHGSAGTGKTFLTSKVVNRVKNLVLSSPNNEGFAYFYCYRIEESRRRPLSILQSYVRQLSTAAKHPGDIRKSLRDLCAEKRRRDASNLSFEDCKKELLESINLYPKTTLVLDALDECDLDGYSEGGRNAPDTRYRLMETIYYLLSEAKQPLKVFISSRPDRDIRRRFLGEPSIEIEANQNKEDIRCYVNKEITRHENWGTMSPVLREEIVTVLLDRSQNMFLWAHYQIGQILELESTEAIIDRLGKLPSGLEKTYDEMYGKIQARNRYDRALADRAFMVMMNARRPIASEELLLLVRVDPDQSAAAPFASPITEVQLLHLCNNLLLLDPASRAWRLSHVSVMEYLNGKVYPLDEARLKTIRMVGNLFYVASVNSKIMSRGQLDSGSDSEAGSRPAQLSDISQSPAVDLTGVVFVFDAFNVDVAFEVLVKVGRMFVAQDNYKGAQQLILAIWNLRSMRVLNSNAVLSIGSMVVHASVADGQIRKAITLCEDILYNVRRVYGSLTTTALEWTKLLMSLYLYNNELAKADAVREAVGLQIKESLEDENPFQDEIDAEYTAQPYRGKSNPLDGVIAYALPSYLKLETDDDPVAGEAAKPVVGLQTEAAIERQTLPATLRNRRITGLVLCCIVLCAAVIMARYPRASNAGNNASNRK